MSSFDIDEFRPAIRRKVINLDAATKELDKCLGNPREINRVYGEGMLSNTALFHLLHCINSSKDDMDTIYTLFKHPVIRCVIQMKWENFGKKMYIQQLLAYTLLLMCVTLSASLKSIDGSFEVQLCVWLFLGVSILIALCAMVFFTYKRQGMVLAMVLVITAGIWFDIYYCYSAIVSAITLHVFIRWNALVLVCLGMYFLRIEVLEFLGESYVDSSKVCESWPEWVNMAYVYLTNFPVEYLLKIVGQSRVVYFESYINLLQMPSFLGVLVVGCWQLISPTINDTTQVLNIALTFFLWALSIQYLEVNATAGFLIPMMRGMVDEVVNFLIFYAPFQFGYSFAYFVLFQNTSVDKYSTLPQSFTTTFLVLLGQIDLEPFESLESTTMYAIGYALLASNGFIVIVLQLNILVAMMTNSIDENKSKAKRQALITFAQCIMRCEKTRGLQPLPLTPTEETQLNPIKKEDQKQLGFEDDDPSTDERIDNIEKRLAAIESNMVEILKILKTRSEMTNVFVDNGITDREEMGVANFDVVQGDGIIFDFAMLSPPKPVPKVSSSFEDNPSSFSVSAFEMSINENGDLARAVAELDKCEGDPYEIARVYNGIGGDVNQSPLFFVLQPNIRGGQVSNAKKLLEHPVMRKVIMMKWKIFGLRDYIEQLLMYCLLLMSMTFSVSLSHENKTEKFNTQLLIWLNVSIATGTTLAALHFFRYTKRFLWFATTMLVIGGELTLLNLFYSLFVEHVPWIWFVWLNNIMLGITSLYFLRFELHEMFAEVAPHNRRSGIENEWLLAHPAVDRAIYYCFYCPIAVISQFLIMLVGGNEAKYFNSHFNKVQLPTFSMVVIYALKECTTPFTPDSRLVIGILLTLLVWALSLQYLEVHGTAGYLIPMMRGMLGDFLNFIAFYLPFQIAYTCAYYLLFQNQRPRPPTYDTIEHSFVTTFLVMLGQIQLGPFEKLKLQSKSAYVLGYFLLLTHATIVIVMLLNVLVAMMAKTVDDGLDKAKLEALMSFAECVLRSEKTAGLRPIDPQDSSEEAKLLHEETKENGDDLGFHLDEQTTDKTLDELKREMSEMQCKLNRLLEIMEGTARRR